MYLKVLSNFVFLWNGFPIYFSPNKMLNKKSFILFIFILINIFSATTTELVTQGSTSDNKSPFIIKKLFPATKQDSKNETQKEKKKKGIKASLLKTWMFRA